MNKSQYLTKFIPWHKLLEYQTHLPATFSPTNEETELAKKFNLSNKQLYWRRKMIENTSKEQFEQEYPNL